METIAKIDDNNIEPGEFLKYLKFTNQFSDIMEKFIQNKITVYAAKKKGIEVSSDEMQQGADDFRRCMGLHRTSDTQKWLDSLGISIDEFETFINEHILINKVADTIVGNGAVESYFKLNSPAFDTVDICHIVVDDKDKAKEIKALLDEEPKLFDSLVKDYSLDKETLDNKGLIKDVQRGNLPDEFESKVFSAACGEIIGPLCSDEENLYEIIRIVSKNKAGLDENTREKISQIIHSQWLEKRMKEHKIVY